MAITSANPNITITTAAKNGTLGSQAAAASNEIIFDTAISTNNGNLEASPTFVGRKVIIRQGAGNEETRYITAIATLTATVNEDWIVPPVSTDTYHISYQLSDCATLTGCTLNSKTGVFEFSRRLQISAIGGAGTFAYFAIVNYQGMEMADAGSNLGLGVNGTGRFDIGYLQGGSPISGGVILNTNNTAGEPYITIFSGGIVRHYAGIFWSQVTDTVYTNSSTTAGDVDIKNCTFIKTSYTGDFGVSDINTITWQGAGDATNDRLLIRSGTTLDTIVLASSAGFTSVDDATTEALEVRNCTFVGNSVNVTVHDDKSWKFINPKLWTGNSTFIAFQVDDLNQVERLFSVDIVVAEPDGTAINLAETYIYEGLTNLDLPTANRVATDANGLASSDVLTDLYTYPASVFTTESYGSFAVKVYSYTFIPFVSSIIADYDGLSISATLTTDTAITETTAATAISNGSGISVERHGTGETDTRAMKVFHYDAGTGSVPTVGETITEGSATGVVVEYLGDAVEGYLVLDTWNGTEFTNNQIATGGTSSFSATTDLSGGGSSFYQEYTWQVNCNSLALTAVYDYIYAKISEATPDAIWIQIIEWGEDEQANLAYSGSTGYFTERNVNLTEGVWLSNRGSGTISYMTSDSGTQFIPPASYSFNLSGVKPGSEIRVYTTAGIELSGIENSTSSITGVAIVDGGNSYTASDTLTVVGGTGTAATLTVDSVSTGVITGISVATGGSYTELPTNPVSVTGGTGTGATFTLTPTSDTFSYSYTYTSDVNAYFIVFHLDFKEIRQSIILSNENQAIPIQQTIDRVYSNP